MKNYCDTLIENLSDEYLIGIPTFEKREKHLMKRIDIKRRTKRD